ncbi:SufD family Fe-S cluster assembly protein [Microbacterium sp. NRRL B-14842]|uniref:SufB/SufD family protein n=1 Tax=Microbacterium sp. NRRL B-14842 TaxID=3162881 RepID=UPI003D28E48C
MQTRSERPHSFDPDDFGTPTGREVKLEAHAGGRAHAAVPHRGGRGGRAVLLHVRRAVRRRTLTAGTAPRGEVFLAEDITAAVAWQGASEALHIRIPREEEVAAPIFVSLTGTGADRRADAHIVIEALEHSSPRWCCSTRARRSTPRTSRSSSVTGAKLTVVSVQQWDDDAVHAAAHQARVAADATLKHFVVSFGGGVVRVNPSVELAVPAPRATCTGCPTPTPASTWRARCTCITRARTTTGDVLYKGALQGESAHSVWIGDVLIGADATGTDSYEANRNLVLTEGARADSIPNLEIETGDIVGAGHASATGRFDDEQLFYLQARGIPEDEARRLVVLGFLTDIVLRLGIPDLGRSCWPPSRPSSPR